MPTQAVDATIADCLAQAQSDSVEARTSALTTLSALTRLSSRNRDLLSHTQHALPLLLGLSHSEPTLPLALSVLLHLSLNPNLKQPLAAVPGFVPRLNSLVLSPSASTQAAKLAASLICSLAMHDKNKAPLGVAGAVHTVVEALGCSAARPHVLSSLAELVQFHGNCTLAVRAGAVPVLARIVGGLAEDLGATCVVVLARMARFEEGIQAIREVEGVVGTLVDWLRRGCIASKESAMEVLARLFEERDELMRETAGRDDFSSLLADLSIGGSTKLREKAGLLMKMMESSDLDLDWDVEGKPARGGNSMRLEDSGISNTPSMQQSFHPPQCLPMPVMVSQNVRLGPCMSGVSAHNGKEVRTAMDMIDDEGRFRSSIRSSSEVND
ncbi:U-box domain-containing protein 12-like [Musa acuminata AAA Group]|uniref:U-box domain-containing protein 12-like n=1 Tax=Musa acuminata AAA Group TaxID=214697 RepID=UPI0031D6C725